jgi:hypothetical protein
VGISVNIFIWNKNIIFKKKIDFFNVFLWWVFSDCLNSWFFFCLRVIKLIQEWGQLQKDVGLR